MAKPFCDSTRFCAAVETRRSGSHPASRNTSSLARSSTGTSYCATGSGRAPSSKPEQPGSRLDAVSHLAEILLNAVVSLFLGMAPERPLWLRRIVQGLWIVFGALVVFAWGYGLVLLIQAL